MYILGLTGPIASGKSFVEDCFKTLGASIIDTDAVVHELYTTDIQLCNDVAEILSAEVRAPEGNICRNKLRTYISDNPEKLNCLEKIVHKKIRQTVSERLHSLDNQNVSLCILTVPLMFESPFHTLCDSIVCCNAPKNERKRRALLRPNITNGILSIILKKQMGTEQYAEKSDHVIDTNISKEQTQQDVSELFTHINTL